MKRCQEACDFSDSCLSSGQKKLLRLVGDKCQVVCDLSGNRCNALWDTGAQISLISRRWLDQNKCSYEMRDIAELIGRDLHVKGAVGADIPYEGYTVLDCTIAGVTTSVPFLVSNGDMAEPIIGYNVISYLASNSPDTVTASCLVKTFPHLNKKSAEAMLSILQTNTREKVSAVKLHKFDSVIRKGASISVPCRISNVQLDRKSPVLFEPESAELLPSGIELSSQLLSLKKGHNRRLFITVTNISNRDITISGRTKLGELYLVTSVTPVDVTYAEPDKQDKNSKTIEERSNEIQQSTQLTSERTADSAQISALAENTSLDEHYRKQLAQIELPAELSVSEKTEAMDMLWRERRAFAETNDDIGSAKDLQMEISTTDEIPVQKRYNSIPQPLMMEVKQHIEDMLNRGWITRSSSAWSSPVVIVRKSGGELRLCCDFRQLNAKTVADKHPLPRVQESLDSLNGSEWFSVVDLTRAYYQGYISPESRHKTAFVTPWGFYQWVRIPFGLQNAPANFQRYMENVISDLRGKCALPYLDDVVIHSKSFTEHVKHIAQVLQRLQKHGLKLKASKCNLFQREVKFLGRIVGRDGYRMDDKNIRAVKALIDVKPKDVSEVRQLLGLLGYHRRHIQDFSRIAKPITDLLVKSEKNKNVKNPKKTNVIWSTLCQEALKTLINMITSAPILAYADFSREFILHTDASTKGLGAILYQKGENSELKVIGYASRTLRKAEANYHPTKLEFLALKWSVTEEFRDYLAYVDNFQVYTDNNPLVYLMQATKLNAFAERWVSELAEYNFKISYRPGTVNKDADCLSRLPLDIHQYKDLCTASVEPNAFEAVMAGIKVQTEEIEAWRSHIVNNNNDVIIGAMILSKDNEIIDVRQSQSEDKLLGKIITFVEAGVKPKREKGEEKEFAKLILEFDKLQMKDGILIRKLDTVEQIVLPEKLRSQVYKELHDGMGHLGSDRVAELARKRVYWPGMQKDIENYIQHRCSCLKQRKPQRNKSAPLQRITTSTPLELVTMDYLHLEKGSGGHEYILVIVDHFTKFAQAYPTRNKSSTTAARHLYDDFVLRFGIPTKFLSDQGKEFDSTIIKELSKLTGVRKLRTTPYHPQGNGITERMNRTILHMLRTLPETMKSKWPTTINKLVHAYNCTKHSVTGFSPFRLMFGREATLPIDVILGISNESGSQRNHTEYVKKFEQDLKQAWSIVKTNQKAKHEQNKKQNNRKPLLGPVGVGDRVLIRNTETGGPGKIRAYWEQDVYVVLAEKGDLGVVLEVRKENDPKARRRVVHRNMLFPVADQFDREETVDVIGDEIKTSDGNKQTIESENQNRRIRTRRVQHDDKDYESYQNGDGYDWDDFEGLTPNQLDNLINSRTSDSVSNQVTMNINESESHEIDEDTFNNLYLQESPSNLDDNVLINNDENNSNVSDHVETIETNNEIPAEVLELPEESDINVEENQSIVEHADQKEKKSIRDLRTYNEPGLKESPIDDVDKCCAKTSTPQSKTEQTRRSERIKERMNEQRERRFEINNANRHGFETMNISAVNVLPYTYRLNNNILWSIDV